jgi:hypothetical protein
LTGFGFGFGEKFRSDTGNRKDVIRDCCVKFVSQMEHIVLNDIVIGINFEVGGSGIEPSNGRRNICSKMIDKMFREIVDHFIEIYVTDLMGDDIIQCFTSMVDKH